MILLISRLKKANRFASAIATAYPCEKENSGEMNDNLLTGVRKRLFLLIAQHPRITQSQLCAFSCARGGDIQRINHHLMGLESEGFIQVTRHQKRGKYQYKITKGKGKQMLIFLQN